MRTNFLISPDLGVIWNQGFPKFLKETLMCVCVCVCLHAYTWATKEQPCLVLRSRCTTFVCAGTYNTVIHMYVCSCVPSRFLTGAAHHVWVCVVMRTTLPHLCGPPCLGLRNWCAPSECVPSCFLTCVAHHVWVCVIDAHHLVATRLECLLACLSDLTRLHVWLLVEDQLVAGDLRTGMFRRVSTCPLTLWPGKIT